MKYYGTIGCAVTVETAADVWEDKIVEHECYGDVLENSRRWEKAEGVNDNFKVDNKISIVMDPFVAERFSLIRYLTWMGTKWKVASAKVEHPRLILTLGGVWNGKTPEPPDFAGGSQQDGSSVLPTP